ncbi:MAG: hypothetical protein CVV22_03195 [Ignavibacteriae bacterium HGW-Ignavibacteriae-1]|jgi:hypothetical protein|nr:MAG: hypothetical protein CVV22_03195 [Ignavibacteriae bacterium HGW-Ignavibacteriae-1]
MMRGIFYSLYLKLFIFRIKSFGKKIDKLLIEIADEYYYLISSDVLHEEAVYKILKSYYGDKKADYDEAAYFVFKKHSSVDGIYDSKYGKSGRFMSNLFKLAQKVYLDKFLDDNRASYSDEINNSMKRLNKIFNKVILYMYSKYPL